MTAELAASAQRLGLRDTPGLVAVSGGADSVALLVAACELRLPFSAAHFHHHLRGADADGDAEFVRRLAERLGVEFLRGDGDTHADGGNVESAARRLRYSWLAETAVRVGATWVATAHTADDQAETVLLNLMRGTGLRGLAGIAMSRELAPGVRLVRPLLGVRRAELRSWLLAHGKSHREDATNHDLRQSRARVRAQLLPLIESWNPAAIPALVRAASHAAHAADAEARGNDRTLRSLELPRAGAWIVLDLAAWRRLTPDDRAAVSRRLWERESWPARELSAATLARIAAMVELRDAADLPGGVRAEVTPCVVRFGRMS